jgi:hypothetical protein
MDKIKLTNENSQWTNSEEVKIGKCKKCKGYASAGWLFEHMVWYREYCFECHETTKFIVQPFLKYVPPIGHEKGYVSNGISYAIQK